jgi:hypothetical protein
MEASPDYIVTQQSHSVERYLDQVKNSAAAVASIFPGETVVNAIAVISTLLDDRHHHAAAATSSPPLELSSTQLLDLPLTSPQEISLQSSCCRAVLAVLSGMWERLKDMTDFSDVIVQAMWSAILTLSQEKQSAEVLLVNGVVDVMKNWIHSLVSMSPPPQSPQAEPSAKDLLLCAFQVLRNILIGFEEYSAHLIFLTDHIICDLTEFLYRPSHTSLASPSPLPHREVILHILHSLSSTSTHSAALLNSKPEGESEGQGDETQQLPLLDHALLDWLCDEIINSLAPVPPPPSPTAGAAPTLAGESGRVRYQPITVRRMICLLCNLSRVPGAPLRMLTNSTLLRSLSNSLISSLTPAPAPLSPSKKFSSSDADALWSMSDLSGSPSPGPPSPSQDLENGSHLTVTLSLLSALAPAMYLLSPEASQQLLPNDLLESLLLIASESTNILHIDQVLLPPPSSCLTCGDRHSPLSRCS